MKLEREALRHYLDSSFKGEMKSAVWEVLGDDIEDMSVDLNPDTEQKTNILGKTKVTDKGYEPSMSADPYYADPSKKIYPKIREIAMDRLKGDKCKTLMLEVIVEDTSAAAPCLRAGSPCKTTVLRRRYRRCRIPIQCP